MAVLVEPHSRSNAKAVELGDLKMTTREPLVTLDVAAEHFSVSRRTLTRWIEKRRIPAYRLAGRTIRVKISELESAMVGMGSAA